MNKPLLICMTPIRNEAWVLHAFLKTTSLWADYIIIADQMSTDGSREIALSYPKVILINNDNVEFNEAERQRLLINRAREIEGDKILFGLDADEIFSSNFTETEDWQKILHSKPGDVFWFRWANICANQKQYWSPDKFYPWMFHDDGIEPHGNYVRNMHSMRIPYPIDEKQMYYVNDFKVLHLAYLNEFRVEAKNRFYKFVDWEMNRRSIVKLSRSYYINLKNIQKEFIPVDYIYNKNSFEFNLFDEVDVESKRFWFDEYIFERINSKSINVLSKLDIWDQSFLENFNINDPRSITVKLLHKYLSVTAPFLQKKWVKMIDKFFIMIGV